MSVQPTVIVIGAGPGGVAAAQRLRDAGAVRVILVTRGGRATFLPGILPTLLDLRSAADFAHTFDLAGVEVRAGEVVGVEEGRVWLADGALPRADAILAAPGLTTRAEAMPQGPASYAIWELDQVERARDAIATFSGGRVVIGIAALPYRCPPAPYGVALALRAFYRSIGRSVAVTLVTPEARPLAALGGTTSTYIEHLLSESAITLLAGHALDLGACRDGMLVTDDGVSLPYDLGLFVPPHTRPAWLANLSGGGPVVEVDAHLRTTQAGLWAIGDVAATPLPRAAGVAEAQGRTAAEDILAALGLAAPRLPIVPQPSCYVWAGDQQAGRIQITFPDGLPPLGKPSATTEAPTLDLFTEALAAGARWRAALR